MEEGLISSFHSYEVEQAVLGAIIQESDLIKESVIKTPEAFFHKAHKNIFWAMQELDKKGLPVDFTTLADRLGGNIHNVGGLEYIIRLSESVPSTSSFKHYETLLMDYYAKRKALEVAEGIKKGLEEGETQETIQSSINELMRVEELQSADDDNGEIKDSVVDVYEQIENNHANGGAITGIPTGYNDLDRMLSGLHEEDFVIIGARPSMGKTAFALNVAANVARKTDVAAIFSLEMGKKQLLQRMMCAEGNIDAHRLRTGMLQPEDWQKLTMAMGTITNLNMHIYDKPSVNVNYIWTKVRQLKRKYSEGQRIMVMIDYLQLLSGSGKQGENRQQEISDISRNLKRMARELKVNVIALSQLSRGVESRQDKRPMLSDLRESGQIEQDADVIAFLYRDDYYDKETESKNIIEIIIGKHRNGATGTVELAFVKEYNKFVNLDRRHEGG